MSSLDEFDEFEALFAAASTNDNKPPPVAVDEDDFLNELAMESPTNASTGPKTKITPTTNSMPRNSASSLDADNFLDWLDGESSSSSAGVGIGNVQVGGERGSLDDLLGVGELAETTPQCLPRAQASNDVVVGIPIAESRPPPPPTTGPSSSPVLTSTPNPGSVDAQMPEPTVKVTKAAVDPSSILGANYPLSPATHDTYELLTSCTIVDAFQKSATQSSVSEVVKILDSADPATPKLMALEAYLKKGTPQTMHAPLLLLLPPLLDPSFALPLPLLPPLLTTLLPSRFPLLSLPLETERTPATNALGNYIKLLGMYHFPSVITHLERFVVNFEKEKSDGGVFDNDLLQSVFASVLPSPVLLSLWKNIFSSELPDAYLIVVSIVAVIGKNGVRILAEKTTEGVRSILDSLVRLEPVTTPESVNSWLWPEIMSLHESTPKTIRDVVGNVEDSILKMVMDGRRKDVEREERERRKLLNQKKQEEEEEKKSGKTASDVPPEIITEEQRIKKRLVDFYQKQNPDKVSSIDGIMEKYKGQEARLFDMLRTKYGRDTLPAYDSLTMSKDRGKEKMGRMWNSFSQSMSKGYERATEKLNAATGTVAASAQTPTRDRRSSSVESISNNDDDSLNSVAFHIAPNEVLPCVCGQKYIPSPRRGSDSAAPNPNTNPDLKYFLIDVRHPIKPSQGKFPTALTIPHSTLLDPEKMQSHLDKFESLRGSVHFVIMGEGVREVERRYSVVMSSHALKMAAEDENRTNVAALFFIKRGFPFVSIMKGGFGAAHAWLIHEGPRFNVGVETLEDYDEEENEWMRYEVKRLARKEVQMFLGDDAPAPRDSMSHSIKETGANIDNFFKKMGTDLTEKRRSLQTKLMEKKFPPQASDKDKLGGKDRAIEDIVTVNFPSNSSSEPKEGSSSSSSSDSEEPKTRKAPATTVPTTTMSKSPAKKQFFTYNSTTSSPQGKSGPKAADFDIGGFSDDESDNDDN